MPPIRVLQVMPAMDAGGMETFVMNVYRTIDREKVQFDFLYHYDKPCFFDDEIRALGGRVFKLTVRQDNNLPRYLRELRALFAAHPEWRIIHGHYSGFGMFYTPAARRAGIPVRCGHSHNTAYERNFVGRLDHFMSSFFNIGLTDRFACSEKAGQMLFGKHPFTVVPNGIDTARFAARDPQRRALLRGELGVTDQEILFGHVGRFSDQKNHPGLLKIFAAVRTRLPKARLVLLGGGDPAYVEKMQALAAELGLGDSVIFAGVRSNIQSFYDAMDAFLLPRNLTASGVFLWKTAPPTTPPRSAMPSRRATSALWRCTRPTAVSARPARRVCARGGRWGPNGLRSATRTICTTPSFWTRCMRR